jgi:glyoxylase-like metal-dependent hydrolase (beta-lactamase superfamily II)
VALPFATKLHTRAFVLRREAGNLLIYSTAGLADEAAAIDRLGGVARQYLNHWHEAAFGAGALEAPLFVNEADREGVEETTEVAHVFSKRHLLDGDFEVIPTPGHTPGATAYLWESNGRRHLFTGDTIYLHDGEWVAAVLDSSDRPSYIESLELIRELDFDVLVPWAASAGQPYYAETDRSDARRRIDAILARVRRGEDR